MKIPDLKDLNGNVASKISPMLADILGAHERNIHSIHITGSAVMPDYDENISDINSLIFLHILDLNFLSFLAPLGKKYGKKRIAAPLVMTREYMNSSLDSFPIEFLDLQLIHRTILGPDILKDIAIDKSGLRIQCEREIKTKLIGLRQGYISSLGKSAELSAMLIRSITGSMALFRAIITLTGGIPPISRPEVIETLGTATGIETGIFTTLIELKTGRIKPSERELVDIFAAYHQSLETAERIVNDLRD